MERPPHRPGRFALGLLLGALFSLSTFAQPEEPPNRPRPNPPRVHALINARVIVSPEKTIERGVVVVRDGVIEAVGDAVDIPDDARVWDLDGHTIHAGFTDLSVPVAAPDNLETSAGLHWNNLVRPQVKAAQLSGLSDNDAKALREMGFTAAMIIPDDGAFCGEAALVSLGEQGDSEDVYLGNGPQVMAFDRGGWGSGGYPGSLMGSIALIRQTLYDVAWYAECRDIFETNRNGFEAPDPNDAFAALRPFVVRESASDELRPVFFLADSEIDLLRAAKIRDEFDLNMIMRGSGEEYRRLDEVLATKLPLVLPVNFAEAPDVESIEDAEALSLRGMMEWEQDPTNPRRLIDAGATVALTTDRLQKRNEFFKNLRTAMKEGLTESQALAALTTTPARILGLDDRHGTIESGKVANLVILDGLEGVFGEKRKVREVWVNGERFEVVTEPIVDPTGEWEITFENMMMGDGEPITLVVKGKPERPKVSLTWGEENQDAKSVTMRMERISFVAPGKLFGRRGWEQYAGVVEPEVIRGTTVNADGEQYRWTASRIADESPVDEENDDEGPPAADDAAAQPGDEERDEDKDEEYEPAPEQYPRPLGAYGILEPRERPEFVLVQNATIWTCGPDGVLRDADMLVRDGKIVRFGRDLVIPGEAYVIDGTGKHVTPGLIDCHSHTGIDGGVNEGSQAITSEVRIADVVDPDDINWYRQLAGGLTACNQLHGSANPIGGQNSVVKLRWGGGPHEFPVEGAIGGIKFALGENVTQKNWSNASNRYPQSRMGVETLMRSAFEAAEDYRAEWNRYHAMSDAEKAETYPPRRDLELDALVEILEGDRLVHCHSYRQDEILMLLRLAEDFGFTVGTLQHILEGYKVASEIAAHGAGASSFSDWWAYKFEVYDAIPYNGALMHDVGVVVSFNSDSSELARRMNTEASKAVRYGGIEPVEALKFVTLNPAIQLGIDDRVGSLEPGKDADFVVWSGDPLSTMTRCEQTWIEGVQMFSLDQDAERRQYAKSERQRLIQKLLRKNLSDPDRKRKENDAEEASTPETDVVSDEGPPSLTEEQLRRLVDEYTDHMGRGDCGCGFVDIETMLRHMEERR